MIDTDSSDSEPEDMKFLGKQHWTLQSVMEKYEKEKIKTRAEELSGAVRGTAQFLGAYCRARTQISQELSEQEKLRYERLAEEWNSKALPQKVQRQYVHHSIHPAHLVNPIF